MDQIEYEVVTPDQVDIGQLRAFYQQQQHATTDRPDKLREMVARSHCFVIARDQGRLIGIARGVTDGVRGYLTECKLDPSCQGPAAVTRLDGRIEHDDRGIARAMAMRVLQSLREAGVERIDVIAYGTEEDFCADLGFTRTPGAIPMQLDPKLLAAQPLEAVTHEVAAGAAG